MSNWMKSLLVVLVSLAVAAVVRACASGCRQEAQPWTESEHAPSTGRPQAADSSA
jgi:hypothetical protein